MTVKSDNFTRANQTNLGTSAEGWSWSTGDVEAGGAGRMDIVSNQASQLAAGSAVAVRAETDLATDDNYAQADIHAIGTADGLGVCCRMSTGAGPTYYLAYIHPTNGLGLYKNTGGIGFVQLGSWVVVSQSGLPKSIKVQAVGTTIKAFWDGVEQISLTDSAITTGKRGGARVGGGGVTIRIFDNFQMGDYVAPGAVTAQTFVINT